MTKIIENTTVSVKIISLLLMLGAITIFIAWSGSSNMLNANSKYTELSSIKLVNSIKMARVNRSLSEMMYASYQAMAYDGNSRQARQAKDNERIAFANGISVLADVAKTDPSIGPQVNSVRSDVDRLHNILLPAIEAGLANRNDEAKALLAKADEFVDGVGGRITAINDKQIVDGTALTDTLGNSAKSMSNMLLTLGVVGVLAGVGLSIIVSKVGITGPLSRLQNQMGDIAGGDFSKDVNGIARGDEVGEMAKAVQVFRENGIAKAAADQAKAQADAEQKMVVDTVSTHLSHLSNGDLTAAIATEFPGEYGILKQNFNEAIGKLRDLIGAVSESAATIRTGSGEIAQASEDLARRTESNAASLEETAASVTQMDHRLRTSAQAATRTVERADQAIATVGGGRSVADEAVQAMGRVSESAKGIDSVIEGLDKIAFQTRVLAMNAAVEAGRAGDAGRGFAVVADLVSALAMRAEEEAKRARDQLTVTQTDIVTAVEAVQKVDGALANISGDVGQVHELLASMAADNQAQSAAITQISAAIGTMDQSTQQNAAMVEETSAAARNLASEVNGLTEQASRFITETGRGVTRPAARKALNPAMYSSPVRPLPAAAISALVRADDDWKSF